MKAQTTGTWVAIAASCVLAVVGILQGVDWVTIAGSSSVGWITAILGVINAAAHYFTGPSALASR